MEWTYEKNATISGLYVCLDFIDIKGGERTDS